MQVIYWLISEDGKMTYVGHSDNISQRLREHQHKDVKATQNFGKFRCFKLESAVDLPTARNREKYWKSAAGRKKLKIYYNRIMAPSSIG